MAVSLQTETRQAGDVMATEPDQKHRLRTWNCRKLHSSAHRFFCSSSTALLVSRYDRPLWWLNSPCG